MGKILFIGSQEKGYFIDDVAKKLGLEVGYIGAHGHIKYQINNIIIENGTKYMVFDIEQYNDSAEEIAKVILQIKNCNNAKPIIFASGYYASSTIVVELRQHGINEFILGTNLTDMKDQLEKCINVYYEINGLDELAIVPLAEVEEEIKDNYNFKTIGVAGANQRIGTTTQALHIVKYLIYKGYKACYIQSNSTRYVLSLPEWYEVEVDDELGKVTLEGIDHFYKIDKLSDVKKLGYDYYVYDYGTYFDPNFNKMSFLEKDIRVFVLGYKPQEMENTYKLISSAFYIDVKYIFSFARHLEMDELEGIMDDKIEDTIVPQDCDDMYIFSEPELYEKIIPIENRNEEIVEVKEKKKGFWSFGRKKN